ncbi:MAG: rubredoxin [Clostridia bacterium]|nr:rubredoxin [Clostridia bacterium]
MNYICALCGYVYKPRKGDVENGIEPGTDYEDLPEYWTCPLCGASKEDFEKDTDGNDSYGNGYSF